MKSVFENKMFGCDACPANLNFVKMPGQIPWGDPVRGQVLRTTLFRLAVADGIHLKKNRKGNPDIWAAFSELLFKQPEFAGLEGSSNSIYSQYLDTLEKRAAHHG